jgi:prophage tail gpP-like protein
VLFRSVYGRDAVGDLIDCSAALRPGRWENRTLTQIAADICRPFGIAVTATADVGPVFAAFAVQPGESAFEAIERACRFRGVLPISDGRGGLVLAEPSTERLSVALVQGENILAASAALSFRDRFSAYTALGQAAGMDESTPEQNASPAGRATDPGVTRYRPLIVIAEESADAAGLARRAVWEAAVRRGRSSRAVITVQGWSHPGGVWAPNRRVLVRAPWLQLDAEMLIVSVHLLRDASGTRAEIEVCPPEGLTPIEITQGDE